jgi:hypothetical protein
MNAVTKDFLRKAEVITSLEQICQALELSPAQYDLAKGRYEAVGDWLASADDVILRSLTIYAHGSTAIGTTVKPYGRDEHDVDLMSHVTAAAASTSPSFLKQLIGKRLRANGHYAPILEEKRRCWRINYANEFHLDITPSIRNPNCVNGGELVPDKTLQRWKATNPKGYKSLFDKRALLQPLFRLSKGLFEYRADSAVEPFPVQTTLKGILRRIVQILKRHRDVHFDRINPDLTPISIILTTLAARSYERCVAQNVYDTELELVLDVIRGMPLFIETGSVDGAVRWGVWNETTEGENFADKWNENSALAPAFYEWHKKVLDDMTLLSDVYGLDQLAKSLTESFGSRPVTAAMNARTDNVSNARAAGRLSIAPAVGLTASSARGTPVRANTFYGAD